MFTDCIILAGGSGTRLWPASTSKRPKQFQALPNNQKMSFFGAAVQRALAVTAQAGDGLIIIIAGINHIDPIAEDCAALEPKDRERIVLIPEPMAKNTAPAIACALIYIKRLFPGKDRRLLVITSDHIIEPIQVFKDDMDTACEMAGVESLAVFGITPERPETGYGYVEAAEALRAGKVFKVASFHEKPELEKAEKYLAAKNFYWNSGIFAFSLEFMLAEFGRNSPEILSPFDELKAPGENNYIIKKGLNDSGGIRVLEEWEGLPGAYEKTRALSFDYAIAEKCRSSIVVKASFSWIDVGSWDEYARLQKQGGAEVFGTKDASSCYVDSEIPVALCGVEDLIVVVRDAAILISKKGKTQGIKEIVEEIKAKGRIELL